MKQYLKENVCQIVFTKKNGEQRRMECTLMSSMIPLGTSPKNKKNSPETDNTLVVVDVEKNEWRTFRINSVIEFWKKEMVPFYLNLLIEETI
jgi:hypothetical protein